MKPYENWIVTECTFCGKHAYHYGNLEDVSEEVESRSGCPSSDQIVVDQDNWSPDDWATIIGNELENANLHSFIDMPRTLLERFVEYKTKEESRRDMKVFAMVIWDCI